MNHKKVVLIGGPSTGKSAIINQLIAEGYPCMEEISRQVTLTARSEGIDQLFLEDPIWFSKQLLTARINQFIEADKLKHPIHFFDRGIPDVVAYLDYIRTPYGKEFTEPCETYKYESVFILPVWKEIYTQDNERYETFQQALDIQSYLIKWYESFGYDLIEVPKTEVSNRVDFILNSI